MRQMPSAINTDLSAAQGQGEGQTQKSTSDSPLRPPVSPITPTASFSELATNPSQNVSAPQPTFIQRPAAVPISESENPDALALRSAISLLQIQKEKSKRDIQTLQRLKEAAAEEPEAFAHELVDGKLKHEQSVQDPLRATFESTLEDKDKEDDDDEEDDSDDDEDEDESMEESTGARGSSSKFPKIPSQQNVVRCPPVNWAKYQIVGESLDKMHEEQRARPTIGEPFRADAQAPAHSVAAPYSPFHDKIHPQSQQTKGSTKKSG